MSTIDTTNESAPKKTLIQLIEEENTEFKATYAPEDNKLRIYSDSPRLSQELYTVLKDAGFHWANKQELFVTPRWTPAKEDLCLALAGFIQPEQTTLVERAQMKAARLDDLRDKNVTKANAYQSAAQHLASAGSGQPILAGHHSQRKAQKANQAIESNEKNAQEAADKVNYWAWRAEGVEHHANLKACPRTRYNRIQTLLKDLRDIQRSVNHGHFCKEVWERVGKIKDLEKRTKAIEWYAGMWAKNGRMSPEGIWSGLRDKTITEAEAIERSLKRADLVINSRHNARFIVHILNRLGYEHSELGATSRFDGKLTPVIIKGFARTHGADDPKVEKIDGEFQLSAPYNLPLHLSQESWLILSDDGWCDLMQSVGYEVPTPKPAKPPILNFKCESIVVQGYMQKPETLKQVKLTKAQYSKVRGESRGTRLSMCGLFRVKICPDPNHKGPCYSAPWVCVFLSDSKVHPMPVSEFIKVAAFIDEKTPLGETFVDKEKVETPLKLVEVEAEPDEEIRLAQPINFS